jgi:phosphonoacetaldehyde hydrolase
VTGRIKAVVFDWAGTTIDYGSLAPVEAFVRAFAEAGVELSPGEARSPMGLAKKEHTRALCAMPAVRERWRAAHGREPGEGDVERLYGRLEPMIQEAALRRSRPIPGMPELAAELRRRGARIGSTTGYSAATMRLVAPAAARLGYAPDALVCPEDAPAGRPFPWMCYLNAMRLGAFPLGAMVKVGDTVADIEEGRNAGMWTIGFSRCGNEVGLAEEQLSALSPRESERLVERARLRLGEAGAHYVVEGPGACLPAFEQIERRLAAGEKP